MNREWIISGICKTCVVNVISVNLRYTAVFYMVGPTLHCLQHLLSPALAKFLRTEDFPIARQLLLVFRCHHRQNEAQPGLQSCARLHQSPLRQLVRRWRGALTEVPGTDQIHAEFLPETHAWIASLGVFWVHNADAAALPASLRRSASKCRNAQRLHRQPTAAQIDQMDGAAKFVGFIFSRTRRACNASTCIRLPRDFQKKRRAFAEYCVFLRSHCPRR
mmetsp:Transcript_16392/g.40487  ORF Transcript_16392/g.40487 Transcript_16392/m.40487 type:complete len:219 (-) Transcript_16392:1741-2397(-)